MHFCIVFTLQEVQIWKKISHKKSHQTCICVCVFFWHVERTTNLKKKICFSCTVMKTDEKQWVMKQVDLLNFCMW